MLIIGKKLSPYALLSTPILAGMEHLQAFLS